MLQLKSIVLEDLKNIISEDINWRKLRNKTVLISGANGMIATYIIYTLLYLNDVKDMHISIVGLVRNEMKARARFGTLLARDDFKLLVQDVAEPIKQNINVNYIIHAASQTSPKAFMNDPVGTIKANVLGTLNLLDCAVKNKAAFIYFSTREIYGNAPEGVDYVKENDFGVVNQTLVRSCYPESKKMSENIIASYRSQYGIEAKIVRIAHTYGPGMVIGDGRVLGDFIKNFIENKDITLKSKGQVILALTYLSDTVSGIFKTLLNFNDWIYNISKDDNPVSVLELAEYIATLGNLKIIFDIPVNKGKETGYLQNRVALLSSTKAKNEGWNPKVNYKMGLERTLNYFMKEQN